MRGLVALPTVLAVALLGAPVAGPSEGASAVTGAASIAWGRCKDRDLVDAGAQCGFLSVPLVWSKPAGTKIKIAVSRVQATRDRQGVMVTNPGGPGGSGLALPAYLPDALPRGVGATYDWIGFDPRGVGASRPALSCDADYSVGPRPAYTPGSRGARTRNERAWIRRTRAYAKACAAKNGKLLRHVRTIDTIRDMDALRAALGEKQINFYGFSYGTFLGQTYATRYPDRVRRMVLDGNVPPDYPGYGDGGRLALTTYEHVMQEFFAWAATRHEVYALGASAAKVRRSYTRELTRLTRAPVKGIGPSEWADVVGTAGYAEYAWPEVADAMADWLAGDRRSIRELYGYTFTPGDDNAYAAFNATICTDGPFPRNYTRLRADSYALAADAPIGIWPAHWYSAPCTFWPVPAGKPLRVDGSRLTVPILLVNATGDAATPFAGALAVRREFPTSVLLAERKATTHAGSLSGNPCIDGAIAAYLATGALPPRLPGDGADVVCARLPVPEPDPKDRGYPAQPDPLLVERLVTTGRGVPGRRV